MADVLIKKIRTSNGDAQIDYNGLANLPTLSNPNLLINSDFRNPVNQRDKKSYTGGNNRVYTIDRWCLAATDSGRTLEVFNGYIKYSNPNTSYQGFFVQYFEKACANDNYTITVNVKNVTGNVWVGNLISDQTTGMAWGNSTKFRLQNGINVFTFTGEVLGLYFQASTSSNVELYWAKLEQGVTSTSFVPRLYQDELLICRRYYRKYWTSMLFPQFYSNQYCGFLFDTPMRTNPTVKTFSILSTRDGSSIGANVEVYAQGVYKFFTTEDYSEKAIIVPMLELDAEIY